MRLHRVDNVNAHVSYNDLWFICQKDWRHIRGRLAEGYSIQFTRWRMAVAHLSWSWVVLKRPNISVGDRHTVAVKIWLHKE